MNGARDPQPPHASDNRIIEQLLRGGMVVSTLLFLAAILAAFAHGTAHTKSVRLFDLGELARHGEVGETMATLGVLLLAATPVLRVLMLAWLWWRERDTKYVAIALTVAAILAFAILSGRG